MKCIAFKQAKMAEHLNTGVLIDVAAEPVLNDFNGRRTVELEVKDIHLPQSPGACDNRPQPIGAAAV